MDKVKALITMSTPHSIWFSELDGKVKTVVEVEDWYAYSDGRHTCRLSPGEVTRVFDVADLKDGYRSPLLAEFAAMPTLVPDNYNRGLIGQKLQVPVLWHKGRPTRSMDGIMSAWEEVEKRFPRERVGVLQVYERALEITITVFHVTE